MDWTSIAEAVELVRAGKIKRIDGEGWTVYAVGTGVIRVDLKV